MADDEFAEVYGTTEAQTGANTEFKSISKIDIDEEDDDALFMQLYGDAIPSDEKDAHGGAEAGHTDIVLNRTHYVTVYFSCDHILTTLYFRAAPEIPKGLSEVLEQERGHSEKQPTAHDDEDGSSEDSSEEEDSSDDDLMINLDENATDYEPSQSKFQKSFNPPGLGTGASGDATAIPGLGGASARVAIGGIPRSAIPGLAVSFAAAAQHKATPHDPRKGGAAQSEPQFTTMRIEDAVFPSEWKPGLPIKLPGQTRVSPEEYKEFLSLGHGEIFSIDLDSVIDAPWRLPGTDPSDFFNFEMNMNDWKDYQERVRKFRMEFTMKGQIQTLDQSQAADTAMWQNAIFANIENDGKDKSLQASMLDARDESYEAFVTSERPERVSWQRFGSPWDHTIVLTGFSLDFGDQHTSKGFSPNMNKSKVTGVRPPYAGPRHPFPPRPPSMGPPGMQPPSFGMPPYGGGPQRQTPKLGLGMDSEDNFGHPKGGRGRGRGRWGGRGGGGYERSTDGRREGRYHESPPERAERGSHSRYSDRRDRYDSRYDDRRSDRRDSRRDDRKERERERGSSRRESRRDDRRHRSRSPNERRRHR